MKVKDLTNVIKLINNISNPASLTSLYRSVEIGPNSIRAVSEFGNVMILLENPTGIETPILLDAESVQAVASSLPQDKEIILSEKINHVAWECDSAKGKLNFVVVDPKHKIPEITHESFPWTPPAEFPTALLLAQYACQAAAVSFGLYGIALEPIGDKLQIMSSNTIALACTKVDKGAYPDKKITLRPPVPELIYKLFNACPNCTIDIADDGIYILGDWLMAHLPLGVSLDHDLKALTDQFSTAEKVITINPGAVKKFIQRAKNLTEKNVTFTVSMKIKDGRLILEHRGVASSNEEYFLADGIEASSSYESVALSADMLIVALDPVDSLVCDYLPDKKLVLKGSNPDFLYAIGGHDVIQ